jgi:hypothetical protein
MESAEQRSRHPLHLVPMGNLASLLVPVAVVCGQLTWAWLDGEQPMPVEEEPASLALSVLIEPHGFVITTGHETITLTCSDCEVPHDPQALRAELRRLKDRHPTALTVVVVPDRTSDYATLMRTVRAARDDERGELFPQAIIAGRGE